MFIREEWSCVYKTHFKITRTFCWERGRPVRLALPPLNLRARRRLFTFRARCGRDARAPSQSFELRFALFNKRCVSLCKIRMLHAQCLRNSFGFERGFESHVHFAI